MSERKKFCTKDPSLASALAVLSGVDPSLGVDRSGKITFDFDAGDWVSKTLSAYFSGEAVASLLAYTEKNRQLRSEMFARRKAAGQ